MPTILETIADATRLRVTEDKARVPLNQVKRAAEMTAKRAVDVSFGGAIQKRRADCTIAIISEVKKVSPSKGIIAEDFPYVEIAREYEAAGADCISCLTEPKWFLGSDEIFTEIRAAVSLPMLRKDFVVDEYQIYQAKCMGADAVLLICALLDPVVLARYLKICAALRLDALVETHNPDEIAGALAAGAGIIGVNNRNLKDFSVDLSTSGSLRSLVPDHVLFVAESGIQTPADVDALRKNRVDAVLIGETLMRAPDKAAMIRSLRG